jgi:hypothetical protein
MADQDLWFEPVDLLSRCSLNEGLLWVWANRVPIDNVYREKNVFDSLQDWECERLNIPPVPRGVQRAVAQYLTEKRLRSRNFGKMPKDALEFHVREGIVDAGRSVNESISRPPHACRRMKETNPRGDASE